MVDRLAGQTVNALITNTFSPKKSASSSEAASFMDVLRSKFEEVTGRLVNVPGMPGVYAFDRPPAVENLNITTNTLV